MRFLNAIAACLILVGVLLSAIANVGMKLNRIEDRLRRPSDDKSDSILD